MTDITYATLASIDVNAHTERKNGLTYLSWVWAVDQLLRVDPNATWDYQTWNGLPVCYLPDATAMVCCTVTVGGRSKTTWLPVMDHRNKAIPNPDSFSVNSALQRALVKAIALCGLGLSVYAGLDSPMEDDAAAAAAQDAYTAWLDSLKPIADTGNFQALVAAIKLQPNYATLLRSKDMATWTALKARQEAAMAPAKALVDTMEAAGILVEAVTVEAVQTPDEGEAIYKAGIKKIQGVMKRAGGSMLEFPSA